MLSNLTDMGLLNMKTYTIDGKTFELDETKKYLDFTITHGLPLFEEVTFDKAFESLQAGTVKIEELKWDMILLDRWINEAPRKRRLRKIKLEGGMDIKLEGLVISTDSGEYWFEEFPDDKAEEIFGALESSGYVARKFLETFLPETAELCKQERHPASQYYVGSS